MKKDPKKLIITLAAMAIGVFCYLKFIKPPSISIEEISGIKNLNGEAINLSTYKGKPLIISFWASWCPPCRKELPNLEALKDKVGEKASVVLLSDEKLTTIARFSNSRPKGIVYLQSAKRTSYDIYSIPTTYFYNKEGGVVNVHKGYLDKITLDRLYKEIY